MQNDFMLMIGKKEYLETLDIIRGTPPSPQILNDLKDYLKGAFGVTLLNFTLD